MVLQQQFSGKTVALTGAGSGIGLACAHILASRGANLSLADVNKAALEKAKAEIEEQYKSKVIIAQIDVRDYEQIDAWTKATVSEFGALDGAANMAGVIPKTIGRGLITDQDMTDFDFVMDVNCRGVMLCMKSQLNAMGEGAAIVNAASIAALMGRDKNSSYSASKHAVLGLTRSAAKEVGLRGIRVNAICPGRIDTPMARNAVAIATGNSDAAHGGKGSIAFTSGMDAIALRREGKPEEVAKLVAFLLSDESSYISGQGISIDGGWFC